MLDATPRLVDQQDAADAAVTQIAANDNHRSLPNADWRGVTDRALAERRRRDFAGAEQSLEMALAMADRDLREAESQAAQKAARERKADICSALAAARLERVDLVGAERLYREAVETFPPELVKERWHFAHAAGDALRGLASLLGRVDAAHMAVGILRDAAPLAPDQADAQNQLGLACIALGELTWSPEAFQDALAAYRAALSAADERPSEQAEALRCRVQINQAVALRLFANAGEQDRDQLWAEADTLLRRAIDTLSDQSGPLTLLDRPRAWDNLGTLLFDQSRWAEAIAAFEKARGEWVDEFERARTLSNLGLTYGRAGRFDDALKTLDEALAVQPVATRPVAWSRTQHFRGEVLLLRAVSLRDSARDQSLKLFEQALEAFTGARDQRPRAWAPMLWAETTAWMGMIFHYLRLPNRAVSLYLQAIPYAGLNDRAIISGLISQVFSDRESLAAYCENVSNADLIKDIESLLDSHGVARETWATTCAEIAARMGYIPPSTPSLAGRSPTGGAAEPDLPSVAPAGSEATTKPRPKWKERTGDDLALTPVEFIQTYYAAEMAAGTLHRGIIRQDDRDLYTKLNSWLQTHEMPPGIDIPTKPEWHRRQLSELGAPPRPARIRTAETRLYEAARYRAKKL